MSTSGAERITAVSSSAPRTESRLGRRLFTNYLFQLINQGIRVGEQLLLMPLFIGAWGTAVYKDWILLAALSSFLITCNFGTEYYFGGLFLNDIARGDRAAFRRDLRVALFCTLAISAALLIVLFGAISALDLPGELDLTNMDRRTVYFCLIAMSLPVAVSITQQMLHSVYRAFGDFSRGECVYAIFNVTQVGAVVTALALRQPPWVVAMTFPVVQTLFAAALFTDVMLRYPEMTLGIEVPTLREFRAIVSRSMLFFTQPLSLALVQNGTLILFGALGATAYTIVAYNAFRIFTGLSRQAANQFAVGGGIEMARHSVREEHDACRGLYRDTGRVVACLAGLLAGVSIPACRPFISLWTHGAVGYDLPLLLCFLGGIFVAAPGQASMMLLKYSNVARPLAIGWLGQSLGGLLLCWVLFPWLGVTGGALGLSIAEAVAVGLYLPLVVQLSFGFKAGAQLVHGYGFGLLAFALSYAAGSFAFSARASQPRELVADGMVWGALIVLPALILIAPRAVRGAIAPLSRHVFLRKRVGEIRPR